jgi:putative transposase
MSQAISPSSKRPFGLARVCRAWGVSRASLYRRRMAENPLRVVGKRGPKTQVSDEELLALIREDLATTEWAGEGHRKVWARLRALKGVRTSRPRVLRLMARLGCWHRLVHGTPWGRPRTKGPSSPSSRTRVIA